MREPDSATRRPSSPGRVLGLARDLWARATRAASADVEVAHREHITNVVCLITGIISAVFCVIFSVGWLLGNVPGDSVLITFLLGLTQAGGWLLSRRGHWRFAAVLPPLLTFGVAVYGNIVGGEGAPSLAIYSLAVITTALLLGNRIAWAAAVACTMSYALISVARLRGFFPPERTMEMFLVNRIIVAACAFLAMAALLWFLVRRYRLALADADTTASILIEHTEKLSETNIMLEKENAERRRVQKALEESEERFRSLVNNIPDIVYAINEKGEVLSVSEESLKIYGYSESEVLGRPFADFIHPHDRHIPVNAFLSTIGERREYTTGLQYRILDRAGNSHWVEVHSHARFDKNGRFIQEEGVLRDITDRRRAQEELARSEERFRSVFEYSRDAIFLMEPPEWRFAWVNRTCVRMFAIGEADITALGPPDVSPELQPDGSPSRARIGEVIGRALEDGWFFFEWQSRRLDGTEFPSTILLSRIEQGSATILQATVRDVTERKKADDLIKASLREKEVLLREIHHRVKNNFQIITSLLNLQSRNMTDPALLQQFDDTANRIRAMALVHEKLYQSSDLSEIDFSSYLKTIAEDLAATYATIRRRPEIVMDAEEIALGIEQAIPCGLIVNELLTNALKYAFTDENADGRLSLALRKDAGGTITLRISDNGPGLPPDIDPATTQTLGLQLVSLLTRQIRGTLALGRDGGTAWTISFPAAPPVQARRA